MRTMLVLIAVGSIAGAALVAALAPIGSKLRVPSVIAARPALGVAGAGLVAIVLYASNFAWIALNNVIAASACARAAALWLRPRSRLQTPCAVGLRLLPTIAVSRGPQAAARAGPLPLALIVAGDVAL